MLHLCYIHADASRLHLTVQLFGNNKATNASIGLKGWPLLHARADARDNDEKVICLSEGNVREGLTPLTRHCKGSKNSLHSEESLKAVQETFNQ